MKFIIKSILVVLLTLLPGTSQAWRAGINTNLWDPITHFGADLDLWFDALDTSTVTTSGGNITSWASKVGAKAAVPGAGTIGWSLTARNGLPGSVWTSAGRMGFSATGLPTGTNPSTIVSVSFANSTGVDTAIGGYGQGTGNYDNRTTLCSLANTTYASIVGHDVATTYGCHGVDRIAIWQFRNQGIIRASIDGNIDADFAYGATFATTTLKGRLGSRVSDTRLFDGVIQTFMIIKRDLTQLEVDKLTGYLAHRYGLTASLPANHPYKNIPPLVSSTLSSDMLAGYERKWLEPFTSLSLRTGHKYTGTGSGYATGKGIWASSGSNYMTLDKGWPDFGHGYFLRHTYNWQALDPSFPPLAMIDITENGLLLKGSGDYLAVRQDLGAGPNYKFLSSLVMSGYSAKIGLPYARRVNFTITTGDNDHTFPAVWGLGEKYAMDSAKLHYELDDFERFCNDYSINHTSAHTHLTITGVGMVGGGGQFNTGATTVGVPMETVVVHTNDYAYFYANGIFVFKILLPATHDQTDLHHTQLNMAVGCSWKAYPATSVGNPVLTVRSVEILAPVSNTTGVFPPAPPLPLVTWGGSFAGGVIPVGTTNGTTVATLSGATSYSLMNYNGATPSGLVVSGSNLQTSGTLSAGTFQFYIEGLAADGMPGIPPKLTATIN